MAKINFQFQGSEEDLDNGFDRQPLPEGEYLVQIIDSDLKATKSGNGHYVSVQFEVVGGEHEGRYLWSNYNIDNPNAQAQEIGVQQFAKLCLATLGKTNCDDTDHLLGKQCIVGVGFEKNDSTRNRVKYANAANRPTEVPKFSSPQNTAPAAKKPWQK